MFSYTIEVVERDNDIAIRAKPIRHDDLTEKELQVGVTISDVVKKTLVHIARVKQNGVVIESDKVDTYVGKEIDKLFDGE